MLFFVIKWIKFLLPLKKYFLTKNSKKVKVSLLTDKKSKHQIFCSNNTLNNSVKVLEIIFEDELRCFFCLKIL